MEDRSHTPHRLQTTLNEAQQAIVVELRKTLRLSLDDLLVMPREFIHEGTSRSGLQRLLVRKGQSRLPREETANRTHQPFKSYAPGFVHVDVKYLPQMGNETQRRYLFVAIDRATRWVFIQIKSHKTVEAPRSFVAALHKACPIRITPILSDNAKEFTDRLFGGRQRNATGEHEFDQLCTALGIAHRLTPPRSPQTKGMVERFNGRIATVLNNHRFISAQDLKNTLKRYVWLYNHHIPQKALEHRAPLQAMKDWYDEHPEYFISKPLNLPGPPSSTLHPHSSAA